MTNEVMSTSITGLKETQDRLTNIAAGVSPSGLRPALTLATGMVHRYLLGLGADHPPTYAPGVLPVWSGRLKNSFFWKVDQEGSGLVGRVTTNLEYAHVSEARHGFAQRTVWDMRGPVNELLSAEVSRVVTRGSK